MVATWLCRRRRPRSRQCQEVLRARRAARRRADAGCAGSTFAVVLEGLKDFAAAAAELTEALRIRPRHDRAMRRLSRLPRGNSFRRTCGSTEAGFAQLFAMARVAGTRSPRPPIALSVLPGAAAQRSPSRPIQGVGSAARALVVKRTEPLLRDDVLLELLRTAIVTGPDVERLLTAVRRALTLEVARQRFADRDLIEFAVALMQQCAQNEYVWVAGSDELAAMADRPLDVARTAGRRRRAGSSIPDRLPVRTRLQDPRRRALRQAASPTYGPRRWARPLEPLSQSTSTSSLASPGCPASERCRRRLAQGGAPVETSPYPRWNLARREVARE